LIARYAGREREEGGVAEGFLEAGIDFERANAARIYDYILGGSHNFAVDREQAARTMAAYPDIARSARANRAFLGSVVRWCLARGVDQFLDLGSGVPTVGNVHEIALAVDPDARVAYVDFEPVAVAHAQEITADLPGVSVTRADVRDPDSVLGAPGVADLLDLDRPVGLLMVAVLHFVSEDPVGLVARYRDALAPGSVVAMSHNSDDHDDPHLAAALHGVAEAMRGSATELTLRDRAALSALVTGLQVVPPGLVDVVDWPDRGSRRRSGSTERSGSSRNDRMAPATACRSPTAHGGFAPGGAPWGSWVRTRSGHRPSDRVSGSATTSGRPHSRPWTRTSRRAGWT
jgi:SAM-dependent methyltransferase